MGGAGKLEPNAKLTVDGSRCLDMISKTAIAHTNANVAEYATTNCQEIEAFPLFWSTICTQLGLARYNIPMRRRKEIANVIVAIEIGSFLSNIYNRGGLFFLVNCSSTRREIKVIIMVKTREKTDA